MSKLILLSTFLSLAFVREKFSLTCSQTIPDLIQMYAKTSGEVPSNNAISHLLMSRLAMAVYY